MTALYKPKDAHAVRQEIAFLKRFPHFMTQEENDFVDEVSKAAMLVSLSYVDLKRIESLTQKLVKELI